MHTVYLLGGFTSKVHHIREVGLAAEPPEYYTAPKLLTFSLADPRPGVIPPDFNSWPNARHSQEDMISTHLRWGEACTACFLLAACRLLPTCVLATCPKPPTSTPRPATRRQLDDQLAQAWHGFGAALALDRTVVLPKLRCYCTRNWHAVTNCRYPGDFATRLPYTCIGDHVWAVEVLYAPNNTVGPHRLSVREHSFLENKEYPAALKVG